MNVPTDFTQPREITAADVQPNARAGLQELNEKGLQVVLGVTPELADQVLRLCHEPAIQAYCPKDASERFKDQAATRHWLQKGRAFFTLQKAGQPIGYGWTGRGTSPHAPGGQVTFALRIAEAGHGQGLATPFSWVTISASHTLCNLQDFWLETWASNGAAVHIYHKLQFEDITQVAGHRQTADGTVDDTRIYMRLPNEQLTR